MVMIIEVQGMTGVGKSTFALSGPLPHVCFNFDLSAEGAAQGYMYPQLFSGLNIKIIPLPPVAERVKMIQSKPWQGADITIFKMPQPVQLQGSSVHGSLELMDYYNVGMMACIEDPSVRSISTDTATVMRTVKADAWLQELQKGKPREQLTQIEYGKPYQNIRFMYTYMQSIEDKTFFLVHHLMREYQQVMVKDALERIETGRYVIDAIDKTMDFVDWSIQIKRERDGVWGEIIKCRHNQELIGDRIKNPDWDTLANYVSKVGLGGRVQFPLRRT